MKKLVAVFALVAFIAVGVALAKKATPPLTCATEYFFVGEVIGGRFLGWEGPISGDIEGVVRWWLLPESPPPNAPDTAQVGHMLFRWEIWDELWDEDEQKPADEQPKTPVLLLAGDENERTIVRHGKNSVWRANGIVTEAYGGFEDYIGSQMHDGGNFTWAAPGVPEHGFGTLRIAGSHGKAAPGRHGKSATLWGNIKAGQ